MAIQQRLKEIANAIRVKQGYDADDFENHPIAFTDFASAIEELSTGGVSTSSNMRIMVGATVTIEESE